MQVKKLDDCTSYWYESLDDAMGSKFLNEHNRVQWNYTANRPSWVGCTVGQLNDWLVTGWSGMLRVEKMLPSLRTLEVVPSTALLRKRRRIRAEQGDTVDINRVWNGQLDTAWDRMIRENVYSPSHRFVSLFVNANTPGSVSHDATLWRAAATARLVEALQASGRMVRVSVGQAGGGVYVGESGSHYSVHAVRVKDFNQPLSLSHLALACTAMFYRTGVFRMMAAGSERRITSSFGNCPPEYAVRNVFPHVLREDEIERGAMLVRVDNCYSESAARKVCEDVRRQLQEASTAERFKDAGTNNGDRDKAMVGRLL